jgi:predicted PurR-regulated permease PerM
MTDLPSGPKTREGGSSGETDDASITEEAAEPDALLLPLEPEPRAPMLMRAVYPFGLSLRGWRRIVLTGLFVLLAAAFLWRVQSILPPFIIAFFIAALLDPIVRYLEKHGKTRVQAVLTLYLLGLLCIILVVALVVPAASRQIEELSGNANNYYDYMRRTSDTWMAHNAPFLRFIGIRQRNFAALVSQKPGPLQDRITEALNTVTAILQGIASQAIWLVIIPVSAFFFLRDYTVLRARIIALFPVRLHDEIDQVSRGIVDVFSAYLQGLTKICSLYAAVVFIMMWAFGHKYALFLGLMAGAFYVIPLIGPWIVAVTAGLLAYSEPHRVIYLFTVPANSFAFAFVVALSIVVAQMVFDQVIYPRVVGGSVGLHPVVSIFALMCGAAIYGIVGMVIAVPVAGSLQILITYFFPRTALPPPAHLLREPPPFA